MKPGIVGGFDRRLAELRAQLRGDPHRRVRRRLAADHLDQRHQRHRVHEVHAEHLVGPPGRRAEQRDRDRRGVRREDHLGPGDRVEAREQRALGLGVLDDRLDDVVGVGELIDRGRGRRGGRASRRDRRRSACPSRRTSRRLFSIVVLRAIEHRLRDVDERHRETRLREHLRDPVAHRPRADHADGFDHVVYRDHERHEDARRRTKKTDLFVCLRALRVFVRSWFRRVRRRARRRCRRRGTASRCRASGFAASARRAASSARGRRSSRSRGRARRRRR